MTTATVAGEVVVRVLGVEEAIVAKETEAVVVLVLVLVPSPASSVLDVTELAILSQTAVNPPTRTRRLLLWVTREVVAREVFVVAREEDGDVVGEGDKFATWALKMSNTMTKQGKLLRK